MYQRQEKELYTSKQRIKLLEKEVEYAKEAAASSKGRTERYKDTIKASEKAVEVKETKLKEAGVELMKARKIIRDIIEENSDMSKTMERDLMERNFLKESLERFKVQNGTAPTTAGCAAHTTQEVCVSRV
jgi:cell division septum initiation protein DivIVA